MTGSIMEREEKRFVYCILCSSNENNDPEGMEEGIGISCDPECRWLWLEVPFRFFDGSAILKWFFKISIGSNEREWIKKKFGLYGEWFGQELSEIWLEENLEARVFKREKSCRFQNLKFEYVGAGTRLIDYTNMVIDYQGATLPEITACNRLDYYGNRLP